MRYTISLHCRCSLRVFPISSGPPSKTRQTCSRNSHPLYRRGTSQRIPPESAGTAHWPPAPASTFTPFPLIRDLPRHCPPARQMKIGGLNPVRCCRCGPSSSERSRQRGDILDVPIGLSAVSHDLIPTYGRAIIGGEIRAIEQ